MLEGLNEWQGQVVKQLQQVRVRVRKIATYLGRYLPIGALHCASKHVLFIFLLSCLPRVERYLLGYM